MVNHNHDTLVLDLVLDCATSLQVISPHGNLVQVMSDGRPTYWVMSPHLLSDCRPTKLV